MKLSRKGNIKYQILKIFSSLTKKKQLFVFPVCHPLRSTWLLHAPSVLPFLQTATGAIERRCPAICHETRPNDAAADADDEPGSKSEYSELECCREKRCHYSLLLIFSELNHIIANNGPFPIVSNISYESI